MIGLRHCPSPKTSAAGVLREMPAAFFVSLFAGNGKLAGQTKTGCLQTAQPQNNAIAEHLYHSIAGIPFLPAHSDLVWTFP